MDELSADQVRHYVSEKAVGFRCYSLCDFSILFWLSTSRFRDSATRLACTLGRAFSCRSRGGRSFPCLSIFHQRRRCRVSGWTLYCFSIVRRFTALLHVAVA